VGSRDPNPQHDTLVPYLLNEVDSENGLCMDFFGEAVARLDGDETIAPLFTKAMVDISNKLSTMNMNDDYKACVNVSRDAVFSGPFPFADLDRPS
jgi:ubiquitin conjugation factor E4 B